MEKFQPLSALAGRILLASMFIIAGFQKIGAYGGTQQYMEFFGVPGSLLPLVILLEIGAGLLVAVGLFTRFAALALAGFAMLAALTFHRDFADQVQMLFFVKNFAIAGGFLMLVAFGAGALSIDARRGG